jgi:hypothetical protein
MKNLQDLLQFSIAAAYVLAIHCLGTLFIDADTGASLAIAPMLIAGIAQAGFGAFQYFDQKEKKRQLDIKAQGFVDKMRQQLKQLKNPFAGLQVATKKEDYISKTGLQTDTNVVQALQEGDASMMLGGASNVVRAQTDRNLNLMAGLDEKEAATALQRAKGDKWLQETQIGGEMGILEKQMEGANLDRQVAGETMNMALSGITAGVGNIASGAIQGSDLYNKSGTGYETAGTNRNMPDWQSKAAGIGAYTSPDQVRAGYNQYLQDSGGAGLSFGEWKRMNRLNY